MNPKDVIRIAESISLNFVNRSDESTLVEFAEAIAAAEREACAKVCDKLHHKWHWGEDNPDSGPNDCAAEIRKRSNAQGNKPPLRADD